MAKHYQTLLKDRLKRLQKKIGIQFRRTYHLVQVLTHTSFLNQTAQKKHPSLFERYEFFGDSILNFSICEFLLKKFPKADEGTLSRLRSTLVSRKILTRIAHTIKLKEFILTGAGNQAHVAHEDSKLYSDTLESLIAAIYLDRGLKAAKQFILKYWKPYCDPKTLVRLDPNPKSSLQEISQQIFKKLPIYQTNIMKDGFSSTVRLSYQLMGKGFGVSKQKAQTEAAHDLIHKFRTKKTYSRFWKKDSKRVKLV